MLAVAKKCLVCWFYILRKENIVLGIIKVCAKTQLTHARQNKNHVFAQYLYYDMYNCSFIIEFEIIHYKPVLS